MNCLSVFNHFVGLALLGLHNWVAEVLNYLLISIILYFLLLYNTIAYWFEQQAHDHVSEKVVGSISLRYVVTSLTAQH